MKDGSQCPKCRLYPCKTADNTPPVVQLIDPKGRSIMVHPNRIAGVDDNPLLNWLLWHSAHGVGLPGRVIVPRAFEDEPQLRTEP